MSSAAAAQPPTHTALGIEHCITARGVSLASFLATAGIARSTWNDWCAGRHRPRSDRWAAAVAAFEALVAEAAPLPAEVAAPPEPVTLTGSSAPTGAPLSFTPIATAAPADEPNRCDLDDLIRGVLPPGDIGAQSERARELVERSRALWESLCDQPSTDPRWAETAKVDGARDLAVGNLAASPSRTPAELAAKASVILAGLGDKPAGWCHEVEDYAGLVQSTAADAVRLGMSAQAVPDHRPLCDAGELPTTLEQFAVKDFAPFDFAGWHPDTNAEWIEHTNSLLITVRIASRFLSFDKAKAVDFFAKLVDGRFAEIDEQELFERVDDVMAFFDTYAQVMAVARDRLLIAGAALTMLRGAEAAARAAA